MNKGIQTTKLTIESLAFGGDAVARYENKVWFIPFGVPGDQLLIDEIKSKERYSIGRIQKIITPSAERKNPDCPYFGHCGGCQWLHIDYDTQIKAKHRIVSDAMRRLNVEFVNPVISCTNQLGYRRFCRLKGDKNGHIGFLKKESHNLVDIDFCPILSDKINMELPSLRTVFQDRLKKEQLEQKNTGKHQKLFFDIEIYDNEDEDTVNFSILPEDSSMGFHQANKSINNQMRDFINKKVFEVCNREGHHLSIFDLYCGDGNFSRGLFSYAASINGIDSSSVSIARANMLSKKIHGEVQINYFQEDAANFNSYSAYLEDIDLLLLDPPRQGLKKTAAPLSKKGIPSILYISCSPPDLARDLVFFIKAGYEIIEIQPFDMFPQTFHVESIVHLRKKLGIS